MYLLDTNYCSLILEKEPSVLARLNELGDTPLATSVITRGELIYMVHKSQQQAANLARVKSFLDDILIYPIDGTTADIRGELKAEIVGFYGPRQKSKRRRVTTGELGISDNDLWIAAIGLEHKLTIVSRDSDFTRMQMVRAFPLEAW